MTFSCSFLSMLPIKKKRKRDLKIFKSINKMNALKNQRCLNLCQEFEYFSLADFLSVGSRKEVIRKSKINQEVEPIK